MAGVAEPPAAEGGAGGPQTLQVHPPDGSANGGVGAAQEEEEEVDPLDAFMTAEVLPEVAKVRRPPGPWCMRARCMACRGGPRPNHPSRTHGNRNVAAGGAAR